MEQTKRDDSAGTLVKRNILGETKALKTDQIERFAKQPRLVFDEEYIKSLGKSLKTVGQINPIIVRELGDDRYELISGENRLRACISEGIDRIYAIIEKRDMDEKQQFIAAIVANEHGEPHTHYERFHSIKRLKEEYGLTVNDIMVVYGCSDATVYSYLSLRKLPVDLQEKLERGDNKQDYLRYKDAKLLARLDSHEEMLEVYKQAYALPPNRRHALIQRVVDKAKPPQNRKVRVKDVTDCRRALTVVLDKVAVGSEVIMSLNAKLLKKTFSGISNTDRELWIDQIDKCMANLSILKQELESSTFVQKQHVTQGASQELRN